MVFFDKKLAIYLAKVNPTSSSKAKEIAISGDATIAKQKARKRYGVDCWVYVKKVEKIENYNDLCAAAPKQRSQFGRSSLNSRSRQQRSSS